MAQTISKIELLNLLRETINPATEDKQDDIITGLDDVEVSKNKGTLSTNNSTTTPLGIDAVFTGVADDIKDYAAINISIWADQASATDGLSIEWSQDGTNWDETMTVSIGASKVESYEFGVRARYFRLVYTNGGTAQGAFRLQVIYHPVRTREGARCLCVDIDSREFAKTVRAILAAKKPDGTYSNIQATAGGNLKIALEEIDDAVKGQNTMANSVPVVIASDQSASTIAKSYAVALAHQAVTHPNTVVGSALDVSTKLAMTLLLFHASVEAAANTNPGKFLVQVSGLATGNEDWVTVYTFDATVSTADTEAMTATEPVGETDLAVAAIAGFAANDLLYIQDAGTVADGEWARCRETAAGHIHLVDGLTNEKDSSDVIWNDADLFSCSLDLTAVARVRVLFQCEGSVGANCHIKGMMITGDSIS